MRVLVTGATGFIGGHLVHYLVAQGHRVRARVLAPEDGDLEPLEDRWGGGQFVALVCRHLPFQPHQVREAVSAILDDKPYRASAARLQRSQATYGGATPRGVGHSLMQV